MLKQSLKYIGCILGALVFISVMTYMLLVVYFTDRFNTSTYINGIDATGMTPAELNSEFAKQYYDHVFTVMDYDGTEYSIKAEDIDFSPNYFDDLCSVLISQNQFLWFTNVFNKTEYDVLPSSYNFDSQKLKNVVGSMYPFEDYDNSNAEVYIKKELGKYFLINNTRKVLDKNEATVLIADNISKGNMKIDLEECYSEANYTDEQEYYVNLFQNIDKFQSTEFTYVDDDLSRHVDFTETNKWLNLDDKGLPYIESGRLSIDDGKMQNTIEQVASVFNTEDDVVEWTRKDGTIAKLPYKGNGYKVNTMEEADRIQEEIFTGESYNRRPIYSQEAAGRGNQIVGKDYVEVDFEHQKMYCYRDGVLKLESDCVTGNIRNHCNTPEMIAPIYFMQKNRTLHGDNYDTFVYYWMAFYNHYGLHDATWRKSFGDKIYLTNGSHGCVNLPKDVAGELYDLVYVGMPVVLYYGENQF